MNNKNFSTSFLVDATPEKVFNSINNVRGWWSENVDGNTDKINDEYLYHYKDVHACKMKVTELIPGKKVAWHVLENDFSFTNDKDEWKGNDLVFDISKKGDQTQLQFTQYGLTPAYECFNVCNDAWKGFINNSLYNLITQGKGSPTPKDKNGEFNEELIEKWKINEQKKGDSFTYSFESSKSPEKVFELLLDVRGWWSGLHAESFEGKSDELNDKFTFNAGGGAHYSKQKLIEVIPGKRIAWLVTESNLTFLEKTDEWTNTIISFDIFKQGDKTRIIFTHKGLIPKIQCYKECKSAWTQYLNNLSEKLK